MTLDEWIDIGTSKGIVDDINFEPVPFCVCFRKWFLMKMGIVKPQSVDRIECTYNRYYLLSEFSQKNLHEIYEQTVIDFLNDIITSRGTISEKEFGRIFQIVNNVMVYALDLGIGGAKLLNWSLIKRYINTGKIVKNDIRELAISSADKSRLFKAVLQDNIYPEKRNACLCLVLNFFLGLRIGELAGLTFSDFDLQSKLVRIYKTESKFYTRDSEGNKSGSMVYRIQEDTKTMYSVRQVPLVPAAEDILKMIYEHHNQCGYDSPYLAYDGKGEAVLSRSLSRTLDKLCRLLNLKHINTHKIRKTFASDLHAAGMSTRNITDLLGHAEMSTTEHCYILSYGNIEKLRREMTTALDCDIFDK